MLEVLSWERHYESMQERITLPTDRREALYDVTDNVAQVVERAGIETGLVSVYVQGATAGIMIQENWDDSVQRDVVALLRRMIPQGVWEHDRQDGNGDSHPKSGIVGPGETIPIIDGTMGLSRWQNIFLCEFDGPRREREILVTVISDR